MDPLLDGMKKVVRSVMRVVAQGLNALSGGHIHPNAITLVGLCMHLPIAYFIAYGTFELAAVGLVVFGLFDTLDGELARLQKRASSTGMFLDSVTDRMKEIFLYVGIVYYLVNVGEVTYTIWAVAALGGSVLTSYLNAWGDVVMSIKGSAHKVNQTFRSGLMRFEVRMFLLVLALVFNQLPLFVVCMAVFAWVTVIQRTFAVVERLGHE
jgi:phosphatidylglycerophosphate synthase